GGIVKRFKPERRVAAEKDIECRRSRLQVREYEFVDHVTLSVAVTDARFLGYLATQQRELGSDRIRVRGAATSADRPRGGSVTRDIDTGFRQTESSGARAMRGEIRPVRRTVETHHPTQIGRERILRVGRVLVRVILRVE